MTPLHVSRQLGQPQNWFPALAPFLAVRSTIVAPHWGHGGDWSILFIYDPAKWCIHMESQVPDSNPAPTQNRNIHISPDRGVNPNTVTRIILPLMITITPLVFALPITSASQKFAVVFAVLFDNQKTSIFFVTERTWSYWFAFSSLLFGWNLSPLFWLPSPGSLGILSPTPNWKG